MATTKDAAARSKAGVLRSISRRFNDALSGRVKATKGGDQRTARKLNRYRKELLNGKAGRKELTPLDVAARVHELLEAGDRIADIRKLAKPRTIEYDEETMAGLLREMHPQYGFRAEAYRFAGVHNETMVSAGILDKMPAKRGPKPKGESRATTRKAAGASKPAAKRAKAAPKTAAKGAQPKRRRTAKKAAGESSAKAVQPIRRKRTKKEGGES
jgi:hypothetical protein